MNRTIPWAVFEEARAPPTRANNAPPTPRAAMKMIKASRKAPMETVGGRTIVGRIRFCRINGLENWLRNGLIKNKIKTMRYASDPLITRFATNEEIFAQACRNIDAFGFSAWASMLKIGGVNSLAVISTTRVRSLIFLDLK